MPTTRAVGLFAYNGGEGHACMGDAIAFLSPCGSAESRRSIVAHKGANPGSRERVEYCFGLLQVCRVQSFRKPPIHLCQHLPGFRPFALLLPKTPETHRRPQLQGLRLLAPGDGDGLTKTLLHVHQRFGAFSSLEQQLTFETIQLRLVAPLTRTVYVRERLVQHLLPFVTLALVPIGPRQKGQGIGLAGGCPDGLVRRQALPYLLHALLWPSLLRQDQATAELPARQLERKPLRRRQGDERVCLLARHLHLPAHEREQGRPVQDLRQGKGVRQLLRPGERRLQVLPSLLGIAQMPQGAGRHAAPHHLGSTASETAGLCVWGS